MKTINKKTKAKPLVNLTIATNMRRNDGVL